MFVDEFPKRDTAARLGANRPMLAAAPPGALCNFVVRSRRGTLFVPDELESSTAQLAEVVQNGGEYIVDDAFLQSFHRRNLTEQFSHLIRCYA